MTSALDERQCYHLLNLRINKASVFKCESFCVNCWRIQVSECSLLRITITGFTFMLRECISLDTSDYRILKKCYRFPLASCNFMLAPSLALKDEVPSLYRITAREVMTPPCHESIDFKPAFEQKTASSQVFSSTDWIPKLFDAKYFSCYRNLKNGYRLILIFCKFLPARDSCLGGHPCGMFSFYRKLKKCLRFILDFCNFLKPEDMWYALDENPLDLKAYTTSPNIQE